MRGTVLSISMLSVAAGLILAEAGAIHVDADDRRSSTSSSSP